MLPVAVKVRQRSLVTWPKRAPLELIGQSLAMEQLLDKLQKFARFNEPVLILGESGVGKDLVARACYLLSPRAGKEFVPVSCPQYTEAGNTISELFGHKKGSFTGAVADRQGLFERADGGVIFLDEIADLPLQAQVMLLRTLADGEFRRMGETQTRRVSTRVIAATNRPLNDLVVQREFRHDLLFRLSYFPLNVPPLRDREDDWCLIAHAILERKATEHGQSKSLSADAVERLRSFDWPGNIRQLEAAMAIGYSSADGDEIEYEHLVPALECCSERGTVSGSTRADFPLMLPPATTTSAAGTSNEGRTAQLLSKLLDEKQSFWSVIKEPFLARDLNKTEVKIVLNEAWIRARCSYAKLARLFNLPDSDYQRFMSFLRTHDLKFDE
jgi:transcriptional regulator with GAF, ATPase, and Fis domain